MDPNFYEQRSGTKEVEELFSQARSQAEGFQALLADYLRYHMAKEKLKELQPQLDEQSKKVEKLRGELEKVGKKKNQESQYAAVQERFVSERAAQYELAQCVGVLKGVNPPVIPGWLEAFLKVA